MVFRVLRLDSRLQITEAKAIKYSDIFKRRSIPYAPPVFRPHPVTNGEIWYIATYPASTSGAQGSIAVANGTDFMARTIVTDVMPDPAGRFAMDVQLESVYAGRYTDKARGWRCRRVGDCR